MKKFLASIVFGILACTQALAQGTPSRENWISVFQEVHNHPMFNGLTVELAFETASDEKYSPLEVRRRKGYDCLVAIAVGDNPTFGLVLKQAPEEQRNSFLKAIAAHEMGHCLREKAGAFSSTGQFASKAAQATKTSFEEAYADAYALAYIKDAFPQDFDALVTALYKLRYEEPFRSESYQVAPLYTQIRVQKSSGAVPPQEQAAMWMSKAF